MRILFRWSFLVPVLLILIAGSVRAQWTNVAPNLIPGAYFDGAMQFRDGIVWAGVNTLWNSLDSGKTWNQLKNFPNAEISDIAFYDKLHGLIATEDQGLFVTVNGGTTWTRELPIANLVKVGYNGSSMNMVALEIDGPIHVSSDGGNTWGGNALYNGTFHSFAIANNQTIYVDGDSTSLGSVLVSNDFGTTFNVTAGTYDGDSWTLAVDSCNPDRLYLANEEWQVPDSAVSNFYLSADGGQSWQNTDSHAKPYLSGSMATTSDGILLGSRDGSGIHRSMDRGLTWKSIGGPSLAPDSRTIAPINDNFILAADSLGNIWLTTNGGGDSVQSTPAGTLLPDSLTLFSMDTIACDSIQHWFQMIPACPAPFLDSVFIAGPNASSYHIDAIRNDSISVTLQPQSLGAQQALLITVLDNGTNDTVQLSGFEPAYSGTFSATPDSLFSVDTLHCDSLTLPVYFASSGCRPPFPSHVFIAGPDANSFHIIDSTGDSLSVIWTSQKPGAQQAWLVAELPNGTSDSVALGGFSTSTPTVYSYAPQSLFNSDSLYIDCDPATSDHILVYDTACLWPDVSSERIVGIASSDYTITLPSATPIVSFDSMVVSFQPTDTGVRAAAYQLVLDDGDTITIPLSGVGLATHTLSITAGSATVHTDTIGGTVSVPITIDSLAHAETIELVVHYPLADLVYDSSIDRFGTKVDVPGEQWPGRTELQILNAVPGIPIAFVRFNVFSDTDYNPILTFDSLQVPTEFAPCEYSLPPAVTAMIVPLEGCGIPLLSKWVHLGQSPVFGIQPNPTPTGEIEITASMDLGAVWITAYDMLGSERGSFPATLMKNIPVSLSLPFESGLYLLRIASPDGQALLSVVVTK